MKLNDLIENNKVTVYGFPAFKGLEDICKGTSDSSFVISTLSPAIMHDMGINSYYAPVIPRNSRFNTSDDVLNADLDVNQVHVQRYPSWDLINKDKIVIVSRHKATADILSDKFFKRPPVLSGDITIEDIRDRHVIGTLPPHLIAECKSYRAVTIRDYDAVVDGDMDHLGLMRSNRLIISDPITVTVNSDNAQQKEHETYFIFCPKCRNWEVAIAGEYPECPKCGYKNQKLTKVAQNERVDSWTTPEQKLPIDQKVVLVSDYKESRAAIAYYGGSRGRDGIEWMAIDMSGMYEIDIDVEVWKDLPIAKK